MAITIIKIPLIIFLLMFFNMYKKTPLQPCSDCKGGIFRGTTLLAVLRYSLLLPSFFNGLSCNAENMSSSTNYSAFERLLRGDKCQFAHIFFIFYFLCTIFLLISCFCYESSSYSRQCLGYRKCKKYTLCPHHAA